MAYTNDPTNIIDRVRIKIGDIDPYNPLVEDIWYTYYLDEYDQNENKTALEVAKNVLARYSSYAREREGQVEIYGSEVFDNYLKWLKYTISNPDFGFLGAPVPYAGGISVSDMVANNRNPDNVKKGLPRQGPEVLYSEGYLKILGTF